MHCGLWRWLIEAGISLIHIPQKSKQRAKRVAEIPRKTVDFSRGGGRDGLVDRSRFWSPRTSGSKPDSFEDPPCFSARRPLNMTWVNHHPTAVLWKFRELSASSSVVLVI
ncbi:hypothetical protein AVEN_221126-1 [Araneus ventricosus]|uniref:Uncharacterized protein n=1 Tax=Araneus ventricosus TaxID=182803 RepID=A0A4Y2SJ83_ARAVE|nr:hypothetical protein AVEN_221126-1 [Araneus ventricosus]